MAPVGKDLAVTDFNALWDKLRNELVLLRSLWSEYGVLFGSGADRVEMLNFCASWFFGLTQRVFVREMLLGIARVTDPERVGSHDNLTIGILLRDPALTSDPSTGAALGKLVEQAVASAEPIRVHRNKYIAHLDRDLAIAEARVTLPEVRMATIDAAIAALETTFKAHSHLVRNRVIDMTIRPMKSAETLVEILANSEPWREWQEAERENPSY